MIVKNLPACLKIKEKILKSYLHTIETESDKIWAGTLIRHYTNHGPDHSKRIIKLLGQLLSQKPGLLNQHERFILTAAVLLHDIGMQSPKHAGISKKKNYTIKELETIRENHHQSSFEMINELFSVDPKNSNFNIASDYIQFIATVAKYHRKEDISKLKDSALSGDPIRLPLLAGLIRLGDELDRDHTRVNLEILKHTDIPVKSKYHWWSHHFVGSITAQDGKVQLYFRFPEEYQGGELIDVFKENVYGSIDKQLIEVYELLDSYGLRLYRSSVVEETRFVTETEAVPIPDDLMEHINSNILKLENRTKELEKKTGSSWFIDGVPYSDDIEVVKRIGIITELAGAEKNKEAAKEIENCRALMMNPKDKMSFCIVAGNCLFTLGEYKKAKEFYREALGISKRTDIQAIIKNDAIIIQSAALGNIGLIYKNKGDLDKALEYYNDALKIHKKIGYRQGEANDLGNIGNIYNAKGDLDKALEYHKDALEIDKEIGYRQGEADNLGNIGLIYKDKGDLDKALEYYNDGLKIHKEIGYRQGEASDLGNIGLIYADMGNLDKALEYFNDALKIHGEIRYRQGKAADLGNIGLIYAGKGDFDKALEYFNDALKINKEIGYRQGEAEQLGNIGNIFYIQGDLEKALENLNDALKIHKEIGYCMGEANQLGNIGNIYFKKGNLDKALEYFNYALKIHGEIGYLQGKANKLGNIGNIFYIQGDLDKALEYHNDALKIHREIGYRQGEANQLGNIGLTYRNKGEDNRALEYLHNALDILNKHGLAYGKEIFQSAIKDIESKKK